MMEISCMVDGCETKAIEQWWLKLPTGMIERIMCYAHAVEYLPEDQAAFGELVILGSGTGAE